MDEWGPELALAKMSVPPLHQRSRRAAIYERQVCSARAYVYGRAVTVRGGSRSWMIENEAPKRRRKTRRRTEKRTRDGHGNAGGVSRSWPVVELYLRVPGDLLNRYSHDAGTCLAQSLVAGDGLDAPEAIVTAESTSGNSKLDGYCQWRT